MARSASSRLFDNIGRRIRHINADLKKNPNDFRRAGLERNKEELEKFRDELRKEANKNPDKRLTNEQIYEASDRMKTDDNLSTDKKKIDKITRKMVSEEPEELFEEFDEDEIDGLFADYAEISGKYIGQSGDSEYRQKALNIVEKAALYQSSADLTENQIELLNNIIRTLDDALGSKGSNGVLYAVGSTRNKKKGR